MSDRRALAPIRRALLSHYDRTRRDLPWRKTRDPYRIWLSEIMLQQTRVEAVAPRYRRFLARFPTVTSLASARPEQVCEEWAGLGYYRRARNLHAAARRIVERHGGHLPRDVEALERLPGIGRYTAGAIASIAFGAQTPAVDGNVTRVLSRLFALETPPRARAGSARLWTLAAALVPGERPGDLNQAMMDLGASVCLPAAPRCVACPLARRCAARAGGDATRFPIKTARPQRRELRMAFAWIATRAGTWLERRPLDGLWAGLWQPLAAEGGAARRRLEERLGVQLGAPLASVEHGLTHRIVRARIHPVVGHCRDGGSRAPQLRRRVSMAPFADPLAAPLSSLARKAVQAALAAGGL